MVYSDVTVVLDEQGLLIVATNPQSSRTLALTREAAGHLWQAIADELEAEDTGTFEAPVWARGTQASVAAAWQEYEHARRHRPARSLAATEKASALRHYSAMAEQAASQTQQQNESAP